MIIYMWEFPASFGERISLNDCSDWAYGWKNGRWAYYAPPEHPWFDHHDESWLVPSYQFKGESRWRWYNLVTLPPGSRFAHLWPANGMWPL